MSSSHLVRGSVKLDALEDPVKLDVKTDLVGIKKTNQTNLFCYFLVTPGFDFASGKKINKN